MIKLIASDLDDTLLDEKWELSPGNIKTIRTAVEQGIKFTLATGRMAVSTRRYARELGLDIPVITYHGALIEQALSGEVLYRKVVPVELAAEITDKLLSRGIHTQIFLKDRVFTQKMNDYSHFYGKMAGVKVEEGDILKILEKEPEGLEKILLIAEEERLKKTAEELKDEYGDRLHFTSSKPYFFDMIEKSVNKGMALKALSEMMGIKSQEVMAVGDSLNDIEMLEYAGLGVAVDNAREEVKKVADYITASNKDEGVARAIQRFVLKS